MENKFVPEATEEQLVEGKAHEGDAGPSPISWCIKDLCKSMQCSLLEWFLQNGRTHDQVR